MHSTRLVNVSLDSLVNKLLGNIFNKMCMHCMKCKDCKNCKESLDDDVDCYEEYNDRKKVIDYCKKCDKIYNRKCSLEQVQVEVITLFLNV